MNIILLSGGSGKRLWPLSNDIRSKQFVKLFKTEEGQYESMLQRVYRSVKKVDCEATVTIATSKTQVSSIHNQLEENVGLSIEPGRRDTFPAIALASAYLADVMHIDGEEPVVVCPIDPYVDDSYYEALKALADLAADGESNLVLMGMEPSHPSENFGYIIPKNREKVSFVESFKEKPTRDVAWKYIERGALWNGGVFAYKLKYVLSKAHELIDFKDYHDLYGKYMTLEKISFDYAVVEKEPSIRVMRYAGEWKDIGNWQSLTEVVDEKIIGDGIMNDACDNVNIINELDIPILSMGLKNVVIAASPDGILVSDKEQSSFIKPFVDNITEDIRFAEKSWGTYRVLDATDSTNIIMAELKPGQSMNYHNHKERDEVWVVISGCGETIVDGVRTVVKMGDTVSMPAGTKHTVIATSALKLLEVQLGENISANDKEKFEL